MAGYIGKVQINGQNPVLVGSTLYGICNTDANKPAKTVVDDPKDTYADYINANYDRLFTGITIHVKFAQGNTVTTGVTLLVGTTTVSKNVSGMPICDAGTILSLTLDETETWVVNDNVDTNTEYVFKSQYDPTNKRVITENDIGDAAEKGVVINITGNTLSTDLPTAAAVAAYVQDQTGGLSGLSGAMHFRGNENPLPEATSTSTYEKYISGDVVLGPNNKEYVYLKGEDAASSKWIELGDEGSYVMKSSQTTDTIDEVTTWTDGTLPQLTVTDTQVSNTIASVSAGILNISLNPVTVGSASGWDAGSMPTLAQTPTTVVVPV